MLELSVFNFPSETSLGLVRQTEFKSHFGHQVILDSKLNSNSQLLERSIMTIFTQLLMVLKVWFDVVSLTFLGFGEEQGRKWMWLCAEKFTPLQMCLGSELWQECSLRGPGAMTPQGNGSAPPTFLVCPAENRESGCSRLEGVLCPPTSPYYTARMGLPGGSQQL